MRHAEASMHSDAHAAASPVAGREVKRSASELQAAAYIRRSEARQRRGVFVWKIAWAVGQMPACVGICHHRQSGRAIAKRARLRPQRTVELEFEGVSTLTDGRVVGGITCELLKARSSGLWAEVLNDEHARGPGRLTAYGCEQLILSHAQAAGYLSRSGFTRRPAKQKRTVARPLPGTACFRAFADPRGRRGR